MKNKFRYTVVFALFFATQLHAQQVEVYRAGLNYSPNPEKYIGINGSPYLFSDWVIGAVKTIDNGGKKDIELRYDEITDVLTVKGENNQLFTFSTPVLEFTIKDSKNNEVKKFRSGFAPTKLSTDRSFFEVIQDGKVRLLRKNHKVISESKTLTGAVSRSVIDGIKYYLVTSDNTPILIKLDQKSINVVLADKQTALTEYAKTNKLNLKKEVDAAKLIAYYNTL